MTRLDLKTVGYDYDAAGNRTRLYYPDASFVTYAYDELGRMTEVRDGSTTLLVPYAYDPLSRYCQFSMNRSPECRRIARFMPPTVALGQRGGAVPLRRIARRDVSVEVEEIVDRGMGARELPQGPNVPEPGHRALASSERLMRIFGSVAESSTASLHAGIFDRDLCGPV